MNGLVDLSLFDCPISHNDQFADSNGRIAPAQARVHFLEAPQPGSMKPLPPIPQRRAAALASQSKCILDRMKRLRVDAPLSSNSISRPFRPDQNLQQRRSRSQPSTPTLTIPTTGPSGQISLEPANRSSQVAQPMIWIAEEQTWFVVDREQRDHALHGFYAPPLYSDPGPWEQGPPPTYSADSRPRYCVSEGLRSEEADSPIRTQFLSLMETRRRENVHTTDTSLYFEVPPLRDDKAVSPMFQEAISGMGFVPAFSAIPKEGTGSSPVHRPSPATRPSPSGPDRKDSTQSDYVVSPLTSDSDELPAPFRMQRASSAMI